MPAARRLGRAQPGNAGAGAGKGRGNKGGGRRKVRRGNIHRAQDRGGNANVRAVPSRRLAALKNRFLDRVGAGTSADGLPNCDRCRARQRDHAREVRETEKAAMTGDPAAAVMHERLGGALAEVRTCAAGHAVGAFPDPTMGGKAEAHKARILGIAEGFDKLVSGAPPTGSGAPPTAGSSASSAPAFLPPPSRPTSRSGGCASL